MAAKKSAKLKVEVSGNRHYIHVPSGKATALHSYLRAHGIPSAPPEPCSTLVDSIELGRGTDAKAIQDLGLTEAEAQAIVAHRTAQGAFKTFDDVTKVAGVDKKKLELVKTRITFMP